MSRLNNYEVTLYCNNQVPAIGCDCNNVRVSVVSINIVYYYIVTTKCLAVILVVIVIVYLQQRVSVV